MSETFTCGQCAIVHNHSKGTVDDVAEFDVPDAWLATMDWNPHCNCGLHELHYAVQTGQVTISDAAARLATEVEHRPVPDAVQAEIHQSVTQH